MTTCPSCAQALAGDDRFCTGCGKAVTIPAPPAGGPPELPRPKGFQWKWALLTIPIAVGTGLVTAFAAGAVVGFMGLEWEDGPREDVIGLVIVLGSMFIAGLLVGWWSPGRTVYEPGVGLAAAVIAMNVLSGDVGDAARAWLLPFTIGVGGAGLGEWLQARTTSR